MSGPISVTSRDVYTTIRAEGCDVSISYDLTVTLLALGHYSHQITVHPEGFTAVGLDHDSPRDAAWLRSAIADTPDHQQAESELYTLLDRRGA